MKVMSKILGEEFEFTSSHVGLLPDEKKERLEDHWVIIINEQSFDYFTGIGHRKYVFTGSRRQYPKGCLRANFKEPCSATVKSIIEHDTKPVPPSIDDVLYALVRDSDALDRSFDDWADELGYDTDSRKALDTFLACQKNGLKLMEAGVKDIQAAREAFQDY